MSPPLCLQMYSKRKREKDGLGGLEFRGRVRGSYFCMQECTRMCTAVTLTAAVCLITREFRQCWLNISREGA